MVTGVLKVTEVYWLLLTLAIIVDNGTVADARTVEGNPPVPLSS
jgi:hypothetical protein